MEKTEVRDDKLNLDYYPSFLSETESKELIKHIEQTVVWRQKKTPGKRSNQTYGDEGFSYPVTIRGKTTVIEAQPWTDPLREIKHRVEQTTGQEYNICVVQRYPSGKVGINPHRDKEMTKGTTICGVSLGETRSLSMQRYLKEHTIELVQGSMYVLLPPTNDGWTHCIKKDDTKNPRFSLTFRNFQP